MPRAVVLTPILLALLAPARWAAGQPADLAFYQSWRWSREPSAARAGGLGGAVIALPDDGSAAEWNPAVLGSLAKSELLGTMTSSRAGRTGAGGSLAAQTSVGYLGMGGRLGARWAIGAYWEEPHRAQVDFELRPPSGASGGDGSLEASMKDAGGALAFRATSRLHVGVRMTRTRLAVQGSYLERSGAGEGELHLETRGDPSRWTWSLGAMFEADRNLRFALVTLRGGAWTLEGTASGVFATNTAGGPVSRYELRQPRIVSAGASLQPSPKLLILAQLDYVTTGERDGYSEVRWEPRFGLELSLPARSLSVQLRAGLHGRSRPAMAVPSAQPNQPAVASVTEVGSVAAVGASLATSWGVRLDLAARFGADQPVLLAGAAVRF